MEEKTPTQDPLPTQDPKPNPDPPTQDPNPDPDPPTQNPNPNSVADPTATDPPPPPQQSPPPPPPRPSEVCAPPSSRPKSSNKRPLDSYVQIQECSYFKMRAVLKDVRPHLLEVLRTVDFRTCKGADEVRENLNLLMELYKQMTAETVTITKHKNAPEGQPLLGENGTEQKLQEQLQDVQPADQPQPDQVFTKPSDNKPFHSVIVSENGENQGYVVGGSAFGWNFITFSGSQPIYCGRTKESFRAAQVSL